MAKLKEKGRCLRWLSRAWRRMWWAREEDLQRQAEQADDFEGELEVELNGGTEDPLEVGEVVDGAREERTGGWSEKDLALVHEIWGRGGMGEGLSPVDRVLGFMAMSNAAKRSET